MSKIDPKVPIGLYTLQKWFGKVISSPITSWDEQGVPTIDEKKYQAEAKDLITPNQYLSSDQRIGIYKMQYWLRLYDLLKEDFPFLLRLFGEDIFEEKIAKPYLIAYPSNTWELHLLGVMLPKWIQDNYQDEMDKNLIYHAALIDMAYCQLFYAGEYDPISNIDSSTTIYLQPYVKLFDLEADIFIFRANFIQKDADYWLERPFPKLTKNKKFYFVLYRDYNQIKYTKISQVEYLLLKAFEKGSSIEAAFQDIPERLLKNADIELWFKIWSENNWLGMASNLKI